jgi:type 1 glutamine amidotransferase
MHFKSSLTVSALCAAVLLGAQPSPAAEIEPLKALLIAGGCCHDYAKQKDILKHGLEQRANLKVDIIYVDDGSTSPKLPILGNPDYAQGYDVIIHDECGADINNEATVQAVLKPHRNGIPGVNLHCAVHSYRIGDPAKPATNGTPHALWFEYLGIQSSGHGAQLPISISFVDHDSPITKDLADWTTIQEELYNNVRVFPTAHPLAHGKQTFKGGDGAEHTSDYVAVWTNLYQGKTRVFTTTIGHNNQTVEDARYLDLVARGLLWACDKLGDDGKPLPGYGK